jgi:Mor family transcriptional regulator
MTVIFRPKETRNYRIYQLRKQGYSFGQLAKIFHLSRARVFEIVKAQQKKELKVEESKKENQDERGN